MSKLTELDRIEWCKNHICTEEGCEYMRNYCHIQEDMYEEFYEDDLKIEVDNSSKLLEESNTKSMLALIAYVMNSNIKLNAFKKWLVDFFAQNNTYKTNQTENYIYMRNSLQKMIAE